MVVVKKHKNRFKIEDLLENFRQNHEPPGILDALIVALISDIKH